MHTVSKGETLAGIARAYGVTPQRLARINKIHDPNKLTVGQRIFVPGAESVKTEMMVKAAAPREKGVYHKIERGETLWRIAQAYDVEQRTLQQYNRIHDPRSLEVGQRLFKSFAQLHSLDRQRSACGHTESESLESCFRRKGSRMRCRLRVVAFEPIRATITILDRHLNHML